MCKLRAQLHHAGRLAACGYPGREHLQLRPAFYPKPPPGENSQMSSLEEKVKKIIAEQLSVSEDQITPNASFVEDLGADSLDTVELVMALEEEFDVTVEESELEGIETVGGAFDIIIAKL